MSCGTCGLDSMVLSECCEAYEFHRLLEKERKRIADLERRISRANDWVTERCNWERLATWPLSLLRDDLVRLHEILTLNRKPEE